MSITFTFNGRNNEEFNILVKTSNHNDKPKRRIELVEIAGRTGNLIIDEGSFENLTINVQCYLDGTKDRTIYQLVDEIQTWLFEPIGYKILEFNDGRRLNAVCTSGLELNDETRDTKTFTLTFSCFPAE